MQIQNASTTPSKSNKLRNVNTVRWDVLERHHSTIGNER